jgi:hypothetical protein
MKSAYLYYIWLPVPMMSGYVLLSVCHPTCMMSACLYEKNVPKVLIQLARDLCTFCLEVQSCRSTVYLIDVYPREVYHKGKVTMEVSGLPQYFAGP